MEHLGNRNAPCYHFIYLRFAHAVIDVFQHPIKEDVKCAVADLFCQRRVVCCFSRLAFSCEAVEGFIKSYIVVGLFVLKEKPGQGANACSHRRSVVTLRPGWTSGAVGVVSVVDIIIGLCYINY